MPLKIIQYPHPCLRHPAKTLKKVDAELRKMIEEMFVAMYESRGIGLAAPQVDLPYRMFVVNVTGDVEQKDKEMVFINPVLSQPKGSAEAEEGCLSLPGLYADVRRPEKITVNAYTLSGLEINGEFDGLMARVIQHETDHLNGVLFIDRLSDIERMDIRDDLLEFEAEFISRRNVGEIGSDEQIAKRLQELENART